MASPLVNPVGPKTKAYQDPSQALKGLYQTCNETCNDICSKLLCCSLITPFSETFPNQRLDILCATIMEARSEQTNWLVGNINSRLPPELLSNILEFLPFSDLKEALLVCRSVPVGQQTDLSTISFFFFRHWKEVGEQPSLWAKLKLHFEEQPQFKLWDSDSEEEEEEEEEPEKSLLHQVLTLIHLDFALQCLL